MGIQIDNHRFRHAVHMLEKELNKKEREFYLSKSVDYTVPSAHRWNATLAYIIQPHRPTSCPRFMGAIAHDGDCSEIETLNIY